MSIKDRARFVVALRTIVVVWYIRFGHWFQKRLSVVVILSKPRASEFPMGARLVNMDVRTIVTVRRSIRRPSRES